VARLFRDSRSYFRLARGSQGRFYSIRFHSQQIEADQLILVPHGAGVGEYFKLLPPADINEPRFFQEIDENLFIEQGFVVVITVNMSSKQHPCQIPAVLGIELFAIGEHAADDIQIRDTDKQLPTGSKDTLPFL